VERRGLAIPRRAKAANQQDVRVLLERVEPDELRRVTRRFCGLPPRKQRERGLMQDGARRPQDVTPLALEPHLEARARAKGQAVEQLVAEPR